MLVFCLSEGGFMTFLRSNEESSLMGSLAVNKLQSVFATATPPFPFFTTCVHGPIHDEHPASITTVHELCLTIASCRNPHYFLTKCLGCARTRGISSIK